MAALSIIRIGLPGELIFLAGWNMRGRGMSEPTDQRYVRNIFYQLFPSKGDIGKGIL
jgi:hypothetical protein